MALRKGSRRIVRNSMLAADSFTYGDWRQYVWRVSPDTVALVRTSSLIFFPVFWFGPWRPVRLVAEPIKASPDGGFYRT